MEFLRLGSSIPGGTWGCCAFDVIQDFATDPEETHYIELVNGDSGDPILNKDYEGEFFGSTNKEVFEQRLKFATFSRCELPNHGFLAVITQDQLRTKDGMAWLKILKEYGFEFIRAVDNSVYTGNDLYDPSEKNSCSSAPKIVYLFGLFRNISTSRIVNPYVPPYEWTDLDQVVPEQEIPSNKFCLEVTEAQLELYKNLPDRKTYSLAEIKAKDVHPTMAGRRSKLPQEKLCVREKKLETEAKSVSTAPFSG